MLNLIGLDTPTTGSIKSARIKRLDEQTLAEHRNQQIGFIFQSHHLFTTFMLENKVPLPTRKVEERDVRAKGLLERVGLAERMDHRPGQLSENANALRSYGPWPTSLDYYWPMSRRVRWTSELRRLWQTCCSN